MGGGAGPVEAEIWLRRPPGAPSGPPGAPPGPVPGPPGPVPMRASFAVVTDPRRYRRPEWLEPADGTQASTTVRFTRTFTLAAVPPQAPVQIATEGPCTITLNGREIGRQGAFEPYAKRRRPSVQPYDLASALKPGPNELILEIQDLGRGVAAFVDPGLPGTGLAGTGLARTGLPGPGSAGAAPAGLGADTGGPSLLSDLAWQATRAWNSYSYGQGQSSAEASIGFGT